jgi:hypothetical protein
VYLIIHDDLSLYERSFLILWGEHPIKPASIWDGIHRKPHKKVQVASPKDGELAEFTSHVPHR